MQDQATMPDPTAKTTYPPRVSVVLPTYNERANIAPLTREIFARAQEGGFTAQVVVVDDDSTDGTVESLRQAFPGHPGLKIIVRKGERGLASALARGIAEADHPVVLTMDSDFNHTPRDMMRVLAALQGTEIAIGSRYVPGGGMNTSALRYHLSHAFNIMLRLVLGLSTHDNLSGFLAMEKRLWQSFDHADIFQGYGDYAIRLLFRAHERGLKIREVPVVYEIRLGGVSKTHFLHHFIEYLRTALDLRRGTTRR